MKETMVGALLLVVGFSGILFTSSSIFFGLFAAGVFLVIYGLVVSTEGESKSPIFPTPEMKTSLPISFCSKCGARLELEDAVYCPNCGEKVK